MNFVHTLLLGSNAIIIAGGCLLAGGLATPNFNSVLMRAKIMRATGQAVFLSITSFLLYCLLDTIRKCKREDKGSHIHPTLYLLLAAWPLLFVRGIYGILSAVLPAFNYFNPSNYGPDGLTVQFVATEYVLSTAMEWSACSLLMLTYFTSLNDPPDVYAQEGDDDTRKVSEKGNGDEIIAQ
jgi:hypothetical protein